MSGRALRRLPVLALARYIGVGHPCIPRLKSNVPAPSHAGIADPLTEGSKGADVKVWLDGMEKAVEELAEGRKNLT